MTRENKLALVVGFGLILLVGILISDHFSAARRQEAASLGRVVDPLRPALADAPDLIALRREEPATAAGTPRVPRGKVQAPVRPVSNATAPRTSVGANATPPGVGLPPDQARSLPYHFHEVHPGESLTSICDAAYGDPTLALELARYNGIETPDTVRAGHRLRLPAAVSLVRGGAAGPPPASPERPAGDRTYTVQEGDMLSQISARLLGAADRYDAIFQLNRDVLTSPNDLRPGMTLKIPSGR